MLWYAPAMLLLVIYPRHWETRPPPISPGEPRQCPSQYPKTGDPAGAHQRPVPGGCSSGTEREEQEADLGRPNIIIKHWKSQTEQTA